MLIAFFAWLLLRVVGRRNAGTRFAVWFTTLLAIAALPFLDGPGNRHSLLAAAGVSGAAHAGSRFLTVPDFWGAILFGLWACITCGALILLAAGLWRVRVIRKSCRTLDGALMDTSLQDIVAAMSSPDRIEAGQRLRPVGITVSELVRVPAAIGFRKPMIVLPEWALHELSSGELKSILLHEFAHLQRRDDWTNLLQKLVRAVFFFHPAVWWIDAKLSLEREMACDDAVLAETGNARAYAGCLISLLEKSCARHKWVMAQAAVHRAREASLRIAQILAPKRPGTTRIWKPALGMAGVLSASGLALLLCTPRLIVFAPAKTSGTMTASYSAGSVDLNTMPVHAVVPASLNIRKARIQATPLVFHPDDQAESKQTVVRRPAYAAKLAASATVPGAGKALVVATKTRRNAAPPPQTLVFMQETQYVRVDDSGRGVRLWRVILINPDRGILQEGLIASTI
nr:M56 family metallopeptidase [Paracidobacterium acidisoli]